MWRLVVTTRLKSGAHGPVSEILREGPPYDLVDTTLERHRVFLSHDELVFVFEGPHADEEIPRLLGSDAVARLLGSDAVAGRATRLAGYFAGSPRVSEEVFGWERDVASEGVTFAAYPGPGDSDGG